MSTEKNDVIPDFASVLPPTEKSKSPFGGNTAKKKEDRTPTQFWLNAGVNVPIKNEDGTDGYVFISFPIGIPCDGLKEALKKIPDENTKNPEFRRQVIAQHQLVKLLEIKMATTKAGDRVLLSNLTCQLYHVKPGETLENLDESKNLLAGFNL